MYGSLVILNQTTKAQLSLPQMTLIFQYVQTEVV